MKQLTYLTTTLYLWLSAVLFTTLGVGCYLMGCYQMWGAPPVFGDHLLWVGGLLFTVFGISLWYGLPGNPTTTTDQPTES